MTHSNDPVHEDPKRIVVHIGFHKTGTSSAQAVLRHNDKRLQRHARIILRADMRIAAWAARRAGATRWFRGLFRLMFRWLFVRVLRTGGGMADPRPVIISCETLSGVIPGQHGKWSYEAAPLLALDVLEAVHKVYGQQAAVTVVCTVRAPEAWTNSAWRHLRQRDGLRLDLAAYTARLGGPLDTATWAKRVADAVSPTPVRVLPLEEMSSRRLFAAGPLLLLAGLNTEVTRTLRAVKPRNIGAQ